MARRSFVAHHIRKFHYYTMMFVIGYLLGFVNAVVSQNISASQAFTTPATIISGIGFTIVTIVAFEIGRKVK